MKFLKTLFILSLILIGCFLTGEIFTRFYFLLSGGGDYIWIPDDYLGYAHAPNSHFVYKEDFSKEFFIKRKTNSLGLVGEEVSIKKPEDVTRILVLGDSFTEGLHVKEGYNFCERSQYLLNKNNMSRNALHFQVLNAGMSGYSPISEYLYFKREFFKLNPDIVILQLFANDVFEDNKTAAMSIMDKNGFPLKIRNHFSKRSLDKKYAVNQFSHLEDFFYRIKRVLFKKSKFFQLICRAIKKTNKKSRIHQKMVHLPEFEDGNLFFIIQDYNPLFKIEDFKKRTWLNSEKYILAIKKLSQQINAKFVIVLIPHEAQVSLETLGPINRLYFPAPPNSYLNKLLDDLSVREHINYLDLVPIFKENQTKMLYFYKDGHLTEEGHKIVAQAIFDFLRGNNLVGNSYN